MTGTGGAAARPRAFPTDRPLSAAERQEWMASWLLARAVGWEAYALAHAVAAADSESDPMRQTLFCEAALTHLRCLIEFLLGRVNRKGVRSWKEASDVTPAALMDSWDPERALPGDVAPLTATLGDIDALLAHVSRRRAQIARRAWPLGPLTFTVLSAVDAFTAQLRQEEPFRAACLQAWLATAYQYLAEAGTDLSSVEVMPTSDLLYVVPIGESVGRAAALMQQADQL